MWAVYMVGGSVSVCRVPSPGEKIKVECSVAIVSLQVNPGVFPKDYVCRQAISTLKYLSCSPCADIIKPHYNVIGS